MTRAVKVLICGSHLPQRVDPVKACNWLRANLPAVVGRHFNEAIKIVMIVEGGADGADHGAMLFAALHPEIEHRQFKADWNTFGNHAGPIRNRKQFWETLPDIVVAFPGGNGTENMIGVADGAHCPVIRVEGNFAP